MEIKILGPGCPKCQQTEKVVKEAVAEAGVAAEIEKVTDVMKIAGYGVFGTPAVVINPTTIFIFLPVHSFSFSDVKHGLYDFAIEST